MQQLGFSTGFMGSRHPIQWYEFAVNLNKDDKVQIGCQTNMLLASILGFITSFADETLPSTALILNGTGFFTVLKQTIQALHEFCSTPNIAFKQIRLLGTFFTMGPI